MRQQVPPQKKDAVQKKPYQPPAAPKHSDNPDFRGIVRIAGKDLDGHMSLYKALIRVRGIGSNLAVVMRRVISTELKISPNSKVGDLSEQITDQIDELLKNVSAKVGAYALNRQKNEDGKNTHFIMNDLGFAVKQDLQREKDTKTWKGWRHQLGQRVRGQHTRTTGRSGLTIGVMKKAIKAQQAASAAASPDKGKEKK